MDKMVTLPAATMQRVVNYLVQRPWAEVDPLMGELKANLRDVPAPALSATPGATSPGTDAPPAPAAQG